MNVCVSDTPEWLPVHGRIQSCELAASVLTHSERDFQVFSSPDVHACVISADLLEIISVYGEQAACHGGGPGKKGDSRVNWEQGGLMALHSLKAWFVRGHRVPSDPIRVLLYAALPVCCCSPALSFPVHLPVACECEIDSRLYPILPTKRMVSFFSYHAYFLNCLFYFHYTSKFPFQHIIHRILAATQMRHILSAQRVKRSAESRK